GWRAGGQRAAGLEARVEPFLFAMDREMKAADIVVSRAGATTLAELMAAGRPSLLIPLPTATDDHQRENAEALVRQGAARMVEQRELTGERLATEIAGLAGDARAVASIAEKARALARPDAPLLSVDEVRGVARCRCPRSRGADRVRSALSSLTWLAPREGNRRDARAGAAHSTRPELPPGAAA